MVTCMGEQEIGTIFGKLLHNLRELTCMLQTSERLEILVTALVIGYLHSMYIEDITWSHRDTKFLSDFWKIFHEWLQQTSKILFQYEKRNFVSPSSHVMFSLLHTHQWNTKPFHSNSFFCERCDLLCSHSNNDISCVKYSISSFCMKAHLVFHWCLYNKLESLFGIHFDSFYCRYSVILLMFLNSVSVI